MENLVTNPPIVVGTTTGNQAAELINEMRATINALVNESNNVNTPPVVNDQTLVVQQSNDLNIILGPLTDADGQSVTYTITGSGAANYTPVTANTGTFNSSTVGSEVLNVSGSDGVLSDNGVISITVSATAVNNPPVVDDQTLTVVESVNLSITLGPLTDADGDSITYSITGSGASNYTPVAANTGTFNSSTVGSEVLNVSGSDGTLSDTGVISITVSATAVNNPPVVNDQALTVTESVDLSITLGPLTDADGDSITYSVTGSGASNYTPVAANTGTFNSSTVGSEVLNVSGSDGTLTDTGVISITVSAANVQPILTPVVADVFVGIAKTVSLGPITDADGQTITYTVSPGGAFTGPVANEIIITATSVGGTLYTITANDGVGVDVTSSLTINATAAVVQIYPDNIDFISWSLGFNSSNGDSSLPYGNDYGSIDNLITQFAAADGITYTKGSRTTPSQSNMDGLDNTDIINFVNNSDARAVLFSGHSGDVADDPTLPPTWHAAVLTLVDEIEGQGQTAIYYQGWEYRTDSNWGNTNAKLNTDAIIAARPNVVPVRTYELLNYMRVNYPARFNTSGTGYVNTPPVELFADGVHGTFALYYMTTCAIHRALSGKLTANMNYVIPAYYADMAAFKAELDEAVDNVQIEFIDGVVGELIGGSVIPTASNFVGNATHDVEQVVDVVALSGLSDDETIVTSLLVIESITAAHFSAQSLAAGIFTYTPANTFTGDSVVTFKYTDVDSNEKTFTYTISIAAAVNPNAPPVFSVDLPSTKTVTEGQDVALSVTVSPYDSLKWTLDDADITGQTTTDLTLISTLAITGGVIKCLATHGTTTVESNALTITVDAAVVPTKEFWVQTGFANTAELTTAISVPVTDRTGQDGESISTVRGVTAAGGIGGVFTGMLDTDGNVTTNLMTATLYHTPGGSSQAGFDALGPDFGSQQVFFADGANLGVGFDITGPDFNPGDTYQVLMSGSRTGVSDERTVDLTVNGVTGSYNASSNISDLADVTAVVDNNGVLSISAIHPAAATGAFGYVAGFKLIKA